MFKQLYKEAYLNNNITEILKLLNNKITPNTEELLFILEQNQFLADCIALKDIEKLSNYISLINY